MISFTVLESTNGPLTKRFRLGADGRLEKATTAKLYTGKATRRSVSSPAEFAAFLETLTPNQCLAYGIADRDAPIVKQENLSKNPGAIARDRAHFRFTQAPAVWFIDYDRQPGVPVLSPAQVRDKLIEACPALASAPMIAAASASSYIYHGETQKLGAGGVHLYVFVQNGADIPRAGKALYAHAWRTGSGRYIVGAAGQVLDRALIDSSVWQPEREDFAAGAVCAEPLTQRRPEPQLWNAPETYGGAEEWDGKLFDTRLIVEPSAEEQELIRQKRAEARELVRPMQEAARDSYVIERTQELIAKGVDADTAKLTAEQATDDGALLADFVLYQPDGKPVTVGEVLENPTEWNGKRFRDPLEPDYRDDFRIASAHLFSGGRPYIHSHAHGGRRFTLWPQTRVLRLERGQRPQIQDRVLEILRLYGNLYDQPVGNSQYRMVYVNGGCIIPVSEQWLLTHIGRLFKCERFDARTKKYEPAEVPIDLVRGVLAETTARNLPVLEAVVTDPTMRPDGSILASAGYSERDRLLSVYDDLLSPRIPENPTDPELRAAFETLWHPFKRFPFVDDDHRASMLGALLTATVRATIPTSPAFMFEAPSAGSGKTLLACCVAALATGRPGIPEAPPKGEDEERKRLFATLRRGARVCIWDNVTAPIQDSAALCAFITAATYGDRVLGVSEDQQLSNRVLMLMTGNNPTIASDAGRRFIRVRIDAAMEQPSLRAFDLEPASWVLDHRREMWAAALTLLRGFQAAGAPSQTKNKAGSFEQWDRLVRQAVIWLGAKGLATVGLGDPYKSAIENVDQDPTRDAVSNVLRAVHKMLGSKWFKPSEALTRLQFSDDAESVAALEGISGGKPMSATGMGFWWRKHKDQCVDGFRVGARRDTHSKTFEYCVAAVGAATARPSMADLV